MAYLPRENFLKTLPRKHMGAGMIFFDNKNDLLILKTNYKDNWTIPGGVINKNESPKQAAERETLEEIGLEKIAKRLLLLDYISTVGIEDDNLQFLFYGGILSNEDIKNIKLQPEEIIEFKFVNPDVADQYFNQKFIKRKKFVLDAIKNNLTYYLEDGKQSFKRN